jgi:surface antigen
VATLVLVTIGAVVFRSSDNSLNNQAVVQINSNFNTINPLSVVSKSAIAYQVASMTGIYESVPAANQAESQTASQNIPLGDQLIAEPIILATAIKTRNNIVTHTVVAGDTLSSLAITYGVTSQNIAQSNNITNNRLVVGSVIQIPPINGLVYIVKAGNTPQSLASTYNANASDIVSFNDTELTGLKVGEKIVIPNGSILIPAVNYYASNLNYSGSSYYFGSYSMNSYNGYDFGWCTWWVANRRIQVGEALPSNLGNAITWYYFAQRDGLSTGLTPSVGAVIWFGLTSDADHVGYVEAINPDGSLSISEMAVVGWNVVDHRVIPASEVGNYRFIY